MHLLRQLQSIFKGKKPIIELLTDGQLDSAEITLKNAELLRQASPWGQGFEEPIFYGDFELVDQELWVRNI